MAGKRDETDTVSHGKKTRISFHFDRAAREKFERERLAAGKKLVAALGERVSRGERFGQAFVGMLRDAGVAVGDAFYVEDVDLAGRLDVWKLFEGGGENGGGRHD